MGQIQGAIGGAIGSAAIGAIAKKSMTELKTEAEKAKALKNSYAEQVQDYEDFIAAGGNFDTGMTAAESEQYEKQRAIEKMDIATKASANEVRAKSLQKKGKKARIQMKKAGGKK